MDRSDSNLNGRPLLRAGGVGLTVLASPLNQGVLSNLADGPLSLQELTAALGFPPRSTMRIYLRGLAELGTIERRARNEFPASVDYRITDSGRALLAVSEPLQTWLDESPGGPTELGSTAAKSSIKAMVQGWGSNVVRALATRPLSLTELNTLIPRITYPSLERRLTAMREVGLLEVRRSGGRSSPYEVTEWLRGSVAPLGAAMAWERRFAPSRSHDVRRLDVEAAMLLAIPLMRLPRDLTGSCRLAVEVNDGITPVLAGVLLSLEEGRIVSCVPSVESEADAWVTGTPLSWIRQMIEGSRDALELGGDIGLAQNVLRGLRRTALEPH